MNDDVVFFQAEDGIRDLVRSRGLGDVYKRQNDDCAALNNSPFMLSSLGSLAASTIANFSSGFSFCLLYTSDAADERSSVDLGGRRIIKKTKNNSSWIQSIRTLITSTAILHV